MISLWNACAAFSGFQPHTISIWHLGTSRVSLISQRTRHPVFIFLGIWRLCVLSLVTPLCKCTCPQKLSCFCLADSGNGPASTRLQQTWPARTQAPPPDLSTTLDEDVQMYRSNSFAASTWRTYSAQLSAYLDFCGKLNISPTPISQLDLGRYIAFLSRRLSFCSIRQYLNVVRLIHLDSGFKNPLEQNWYVASILKGVRRVKGDSSLQKLPITLDILRAIFMKLDLKCSFERSFWTACLVAFFSFFRKSNLLVQSHILFDPLRHLCASDVEFTQEGAVLTVRWSKVIQFKERILHIPLPRIQNSPFCPSSPF